MTKAQAQPTQRSQTIQGRGAYTDRKFMLLDELAKQFYDAGDYDLAQLANCSPYLVRKWRKARQQA